ncbi:hypothetical protein APP_11100 [Aeribacillus pallidus]|jgi:hypothetical protein|nr:hypothetical protein APP_11100 [Aeribacillus pallidus]
MRFTVYFFEEKSKKINFGNKWATIRKFRRSEKKQNRRTVVVPGFRG